jgi:hypothetical protein
MIKPAPHIVRWFLKTFGYGGVTIPPLGIYILAERIDENRLRRHESMHWQQYLRMGMLKFYAVYFWYNVRYGYYMNPMEIEARDAETSIQS